MKRCFGLLLIVLFCFTIFAGCKTSLQKAESSQASSPGQSAATAAAETKPAEPKKLFEEPVKISMMMRSAATWAYQEDWFIKKAIEERTNIQLAVEAIGGSATDFTNKVNLSLASGELPDLVYIGGTDITNIAKKYGPQGAVVNAAGYLGKLPNLKKWSEAYPDELIPYLSPDGSMYLFPNYGIGETNRQGYLYRKDIFDKHKLALPTNDQELYNVLKELKKLYPDTYPFTYRSQLEQFLMMSESWGTGWKAYYNSATNKWGYGPIEDNFKTMAIYLNKLYNEGLMPPDWLTLDTKGWQDIMATEKAFVTLDYISRIDGFNNMVRGTNPSFTMAYMPPIKGGENGVAKMSASAETFAGYMVSAKSKNLDKVMKYMDWLYSDEAKELVSWGIEGVTYKVENGQRKFIDAQDLAAVRVKYGLATFGFYLLYDFDAHMVTYGDELRQAIEEDKKYDLPAQPKVSFTDEEMKIMQTVGINVEDHMKENLSKFLLGSRPFSEWDQYVKEMKDLGVDQIVELYTKAYNRLKK